MEERASQGCKQHEGMLEQGCSKDTVHGGLVRKQECGLQ